MIRPADDTPLKGGLGGGAKPTPAPVPTVAQIDPRTPGKDLRLIASAVRKGWVIPDEAMTVLPAALLRVALDKNEEVRARVNAAKVVVAMHGQNEPAPPAEVNVGVSVSVGDTVRGLLHEQGYLDYLRNTGDHGPNGQ
jgi:hypothetical protein